MDCAFPDFPRTYQEPHSSWAKVMIGRVRLGAHQNKGEEVTALPEPQWQDTPACRQELGDLTHDSFACA